MSTYTVRVELHSDQYYPDFETLHREMESRSFERMITADSGDTYHLPRGEYNISTDKSKNEVLETAKEAVDTTGKSAEILVTKSAGRTWSGLSRKEEEE